MNTSTSPETNLSAAAERARLIRWLLVTAAVFAFLYLLLCTYLWNIVYGIFFVLMTNNARNAEAAASSWCKPGDWVLETFQPMVSDKKMIDHYLKNKEAMTQIAEMAARQKNVDKNGLTDKFIKMEKSLRMESVGSSAPWAEQPYSIENIEASRACRASFNDFTSKEKLLECWRNDVKLGRGIFAVHAQPAFGKNHAQYFCSTQKNSAKGYVYYPGGKPRVENGKLFAAVYYSDRYKTYVTEDGTVLDTSTDADPRGNKTLLRQIDERWFIYRN